MPLTKAQRSFLQKNLKKIISGVEVLNPESLHAPTYYSLVNELSKYIAQSAAKSTNSMELELSHNVIDCNVSGLKRTIKKLLPKK